MRLEERPREDEEEEPRAEAASAAVAAGSSGALAPPDVDDRDDECADDRRDDSVGVSVEGAADDAAADGNDWADGCMARTRRPLRGIRTPRGVRARRGVIGACVCCAPRDQSE